MKAFDIATSFKNVVLAVCLVFGLVLSASAAADAVDVAISHIGDRYEWGGNGPNSFDCSGLTSYVYAQSGVTLPRRAIQQSTSGTGVSTAGPFQRGDLLFFETDDNYPGLITHVGIYESGNTFINANGLAEKVKRNTLNSWWGPRLLAARRITETAGQRVSGQATALVTYTYVIDANGNYSHSTVLPTPNGIKIGDTVVAEFTYKADQADSFSSSDEGRYYYYPAAPTNIRLRVNGINTSAANTVWITMFHNKFRGSPTNWYESIFLIQSAGSSFPGYPIGIGGVDLKIAHLFDTSRNSLLKSDDLPISSSDVNLSEANIAELDYRSDAGTYPPGSWGFGAEVDLNSFRFTVD